MDAYFWSESCAGCKPAKRSKGPRSRAGVGRDCHWRSIPSSCIADRWEPRYMKFVSAPRHHAGGVICALAMTDQREYPSGSTERGSRCQGCVSTGGDGNLQNKVVLRYHGQQLEQSRAYHFCVCADDQFPAHLAPEIDRKLELSWIPGTKQVKHDP